MRKLVLLLPVLIVLVSGCATISPEDLARASPVVKNFLAEYPNAKITATHFTESQAESMLEVIKQDCDNPYLEAKEYYRFTVDDNETGFKAVVWIDWENQIIECAYKEGYLGKREYGDREVDPNRCVSRHIRKCHDNNAYWYDSCGNKQEKAEACNYGCAEGRCVQSECKSHAQSNCYGVHVYWFDSCGHVQEKKEYCEYGCENGFCKNKTVEKECFDSDGGKNYYVKGVVETHTQRLEDHCNNDGTLTEKYCTETGEAKAETVGCPDGCSEGVCLSVNQTDPCEGVTCSDGCYNESDRKYDGSCVEGECVYDYEYCPGGCSEGTCLPDTSGYFCTDTDGGIDYTVKGYVNWSNGTDPGYVSDYCSDSLLSEWYCQDVFPGYPGYETHECPNGCSDGVCLPESQVECTENSDCGSGYMCIENSCVEIPSSGCTTDGLCTLNAGDNVTYGMILSFSEIDSNNKAVVLVNWESKAIELIHSMSYPEHSLSVYYYGEHLTSLFESRIVVVRVFTNISILYATGFPSLGIPLTWEYYSNGELKVELRNGFNRDGVGESVTINSVTANCGPDQAEVTLSTEATSTVVNSRHTIEYTTSGCEAPGPGVYTISLLEVTYKPELSAYARADSGTIRGTVI
jgi:hypothetical protein